MVYSVRRIVLSLALCYFLLLLLLFYLFIYLFIFVFFNPFSISIASLGEERAYLSAFCTFVRFALVCFLSSVSPSSSCLGWAAVCDCGTPWTFPLPFY